MVDDLEDRGPQDRSRVNLNEDWEVRWWARAWEITPEQLREAVKQVGTSASAVAKHLGKSTAF